MTALTNDPATRPQTPAEDPSPAASHALVSSASQANPLETDAIAAAKAVESTLVIKIPTPVWVVLASIILANVAGVIFHI